MEPLAWHHRADLGKGIVAHIGLESALVVRAGVNPVTDLTQLYRDYIESGLALVAGMNADRTALSSKVFFVNRSGDGDLDPGWEWWENSDKHYTECDDAALHKLVFGGDVTSIIGNAKHTTPGVITVAVAPSPRYMEHEASFFSLFFTQRHFGNDLDIYYLRLPSDEPLSPDIIKVGKIFGYEVKDRALSDTEMNELEGWKNLRGNILKLIAPILFPDKERLIVWDGDGKAKGNLKGLWNKPMLGLPTGTVSIYAPSSDPFGPPAFAPDVDDLGNIRLFSANSIFGSIYLYDVPKVLERYPTIASVRKELEFASYPYAWDEYRFRLMWNGKHMSIGQEWTVSSGISHHHPLRAVENAYSWQEHTHPHPLLYPSWKTVENGNGGLYEHWMAWEYQEAIDSGKSPLDSAAFPVFLGVYHGNFGAVQKTVKSMAVRAGRKLVFVLATSDKSSWSGVADFRSYVENLGHCLLVCPMDKVLTEGAACEITAWMCALYGAPWWEEVLWVHPGTTFTESLPEVFLPTLPPDTALAWNTANYKEYVGLVEGREEIVSVVRFRPTDVRSKACLVSVKEWLSRSRRESSPIPVKTLLVPHLLSRWITVKVQDTLIGNLTWILGSDEVGWNYAKHPASRLDTLSVLLAIDSTEASETVALMNMLSLVANSKKPVRVYLWTRKATPGVKAIVDIAERLHLPLTPITPADVEHSDAWTDAPDNCAHLGALTFEFPCSHVALLDAHSVLTGDIARCFDDRTDNPKLVTSRESGDMWTNKSSGDWLCRMDAGYLFVAQVPHIHWCGGVLTTSLTKRPRVRQALQDNCIPGADPARILGTCLEHVSFSHSSWCVRPVFKDGKKVENGTVWILSDSVRDELLRTGQRAHFFPPATEAIWKSLPTLKRKIAIGDPTELDSICDKWRITTPSQLPSSTDSL
jgi:hypothetical protein